MNKEKYYFPKEMEMAIDKDIRLHVLYRFCNYGSYGAWMMRARCPACAKNRIWCNAAPKYDICAFCRNLDIRVDS